MGEWEDISDEVVVAEHGPLFDNPDPYDRLQIEDLSDHPRVDADGREIPIYDEDGFIVPRRNALAYDGDPDSSVLIDLPEFMEQFTSPSHTTEDRFIDRKLAGLRSECFGPSRNPTDVWTYPLGLLKTFGNVQATNGFPAFVARIRALCYKVQKHRRQGRANQAADTDDDDDGDYNDDEEEDEDEENSRSRAHPVGDGKDVLAIEVVSMQGYNVISHRVREAARYHEAQLGLNGGAAAGTHATSAKAKRAAQRTAAKNKRDLPHERFRNVINDPSSTPRDLRLETVFVVNLDGLREADRNGRCVIP